VLWRTLAVGALCALVLAASASGGASALTVSLTVTLHGAGTVKVSGKPSITCDLYASGAMNTCSHTLHVKKGSRVMLVATPATFQKLGPWKGACKGTVPRCKLNMTRNRRVTATFIRPSEPGSRSNPYPLGTTVTLTHGFQFKVNSATLNADAEVEAVKDQYGNPVNPPPTAGNQYALVNATVTYVGQDPSYLGERIKSDLLAEADHDLNPYYPDDQCTPPPLDLGSVGEVTTGQGATGNLCLEITTSDAATLMLGGYVTNGQNTDLFWFALR
jgi:hypothetical protein